MSSNCSRSALASPERSVVRRFGTIGTSSSRMGLEVLFVASVLCVVAACGDDQDPDGARAFLERIQEEDYRAWARAPGFEERRSSNAPHGEEVDIYVNDAVVAVLEAGEPVEAWPEGSVIVKDGWDGASLELIAAMEKRSDGWYWAEWDGEGQSLYSGKPDVCVGCHASGSDFVRSFGF
jgi:hypothetical protein